MSQKHRKTLLTLLVDPVDGHLESLRIESLLLALGCRSIEGQGSAVTFEDSGHKANLHRSPFDKEALRYRVQTVREFIQKIGIEL